MKKFTLLSVFLLSLTLVTACGSDEKDVEMTDNSDSVGLNLEVTDSTEASSSVGMNLEVMEETQEENVGINLNVTTSEEAAE